MAGEASAGAGAGGRQQEKLVARNAEAFDSADVPCETHRPYQDETCAGAGEMHRPCRCLRCGGAGETHRTWGATPATSAWQEKLIGRHAERFDSTDVPSERSDRRRGRRHRTGDAAARSRIVRGPLLALLLCFHALGCAAMCTRNKCPRPCPANDSTFKWPKQCGRACCRWNFPHLFLNETTARNHSRLGWHHAHNHTSHRAHRHPELPAYNPMHRHSEEWQRTCAAANNSMKQQPAPDAELPTKPPWPQPPMVAMGCSPDAWSMLAALLSSLATLSSAELHVFHLPDQEPPIGLWLPTAAHSRLRLHAFTEAQFRQAGSDIITPALHRSSYMTNPYNWIKFHLDLYLSTEAVLWMDCDMLVVSSGVDSIFEQNVLVKPFAAIRLPQRFSHFLCRVEREQSELILNASLPADMHAQLCRAHSDTSLAYIASPLLVRTRRFDWTAIRSRWRIYAALHRVKCLWSLSSQTELQLMELVQHLKLPGRLLQYLSSSSIVKYYQGGATVRYVEEFQSRLQQLRALPHDAPALILHWNGPSKPRLCPGKLGHGRPIGEDLWREFLPIGFMAQDSSGCFQCNLSALSSGFDVHIGLRHMFCRVVPPSNATNHTELPMKSHTRGHHSKRTHESQKHKHHTGKKDATKKRG